jgi:F420-dependent methylenetetrahydromethanopterin dehydrogenase
VKEKGFDVRVTHFSRMAFVVEENEALDPVDVGFFGADGIALETYGVANAIQETFGTVFHCSP